jgi:hypothetical protein
MLEILPCDTKDNHINNRFKYGCNVCAIKFSGIKATAILEWLYKDATIYLQRKYDKTLELI